MNSLSLTAQSSLWALFQLKNSKKRNFLIFVALLPIIFLLSCFIVDIVLNSINFIQYFEFNSKNIKAGFIESMFAYSSVKVVFIVFFSVIHLLIVLPGLKKLILSENELKKSNDGSIVKHIKESYATGKQISSLLIVQFWVDMFWYLTYIAIAFLDFMNLQFVYNNHNLNDTYPDQVSFGINLGFAISALIKITIIDNVIPLVFHKKPKNYVVNGNAANYLWLYIIWISSFMFLVLTTIAGLHLKIISWVFIYSSPVIITPLMFLLTYIIKTIYIIKLNKHNRTALTYVSAFLVLFSYE
ncbi:hypothetical protein MBOVa_1210 [Mycoplasmopsis bovis 8790]|nr:hypothetical protein MBOVa_1210 [Mycoplasmopsis bovis 8790]